MADREALRDAAGRAVATFVPGTRDGLPLADDVAVAPGVALADVAAAAEASLGGHIVGAAVDLGELLVARGATARRRVVVMTRDLRPAVAPVTPAAGVSVAPAGATAPDALLDAYIAAYPPGHPDHRPGLGRDGEREELRELMAGEVIGTQLACSRIAVAGGEEVGAALLYDHRGVPPLGGPWVGELFRHPDAPAGTGAALLASALSAARAGGMATVGLVVTEGNPARRLYERAGFVERQRLFAVLLPPR